MTLDEAGVTVLPAPLTVQLAPMPEIGLLLLSSSVTVTVEAAVLSAGKVVGLATTVELVGLIGAGTRCSTTELPPTKRLPIVPEIAVPLTVKVPLEEIVLLRFVTMV